MLFMWTPVPGTITPEPQPVEAEREAALPAASTTDGASGTRPPGGRLDGRIGKQAVGKTAPIEVALESRPASERRLAHYLCERGHRFDAAGRPGRAETVEDPKRERDEDSARRWRGIGDELERAVGSADRAAPDDAVLGQVLLRKQPAALAHGSTERTGERPPVEGDRTLGREQVECVREIRHRQPLAGSKGRAFAIDASPFALRAKGDVENRMEKCLLRIKVDAVPSHLCGRRNQFRPRDAAVQTMRLAETGHDPRDAARGAADPEELERVLVERDFDLVHCGRLGSGRAAPGNRDEEVEQAIAPIRGPVDEHEPARPRSGQRALRHPGDEPGRDAGVDRVSALLENPRARLRGQRVAGGHCASHAGEISGPGPDV
jgi:hypothetical protein